MKILYKYTSRSRPANFKRGLDSIFNLSNISNFDVLVTLDEDDDKLSEYLKICDQYGSDVVAYVGTSENKVHAINRDINEWNRDWEILVNMSDDMLFIQKGFDDIIRAAFNEGQQYYFRDEKGNTLNVDLDRFIHFNDGNQRSNVCTMSIMGKQYFRRDKYIYHPSYESVWCDVEATEHAKLRGCYHYMGDMNIIFKHLHPAWGLAQYDEQYQKWEDHKYYDKDYRNYLDRKTVNFPA